MEQPVTSNDYGDPKYVTVLPDYLDMTVDYKIFRWLIIFVIILIVIALIILAIIAVSTARNGGIIEPPPQTVRGAEFLQSVDFTLVSQTFGLHDNPGATTADVPYRYIDDGTALQSPDACSSVPYRKWNSTANSCECIAPFWGKYCERESFNSKNVAFGHITPEVEGSIDYIDEIEVNRQSFKFAGSNADQTTCDQMCADNPNCIGYVLERKSPTFGTDTTDQTIMCKLIGEIPDSLIQGLTFDPQIDVNLFFSLGQVQRPKLPGFVFLFNGGLKRRFWLEQRVTNKNYNLVNIGIERLNHIHFYPESIINDSDAYVVFSYKHFTLPEAVAMIAIYKEDGKVPFGWHVYSPGDNILNPPHSWTTDGGNFWVMAVSKETITVQRKK